MKDHRILWILALAVPVLAACTHPAPAARTTPSSSPSPAVTQARGVDVSDVPDGLGADERLAARFVILANTSDAAIDQTATAAWSRAAALATPELADQIRTSRQPAGAGWQTVRAKKGWVSVQITNVLDGHPQAPGAPAVSGTPIVVLFQQTYHTGSTASRDTNTQQWNVTVTDGKVSNFVMGGA